MFSISEWQESSSKTMERLCVLPETMLDSGKKREMKDQRQFLIQRNSQIRSYRLSRQQGSGTVREGQRSMGVKTPFTVAETLNRGCT